MHAFLNPGCVWLGMFQSEFFDAALNQSNRKPFVKWRSVAQFKKFWQCRAESGASICLCAPAKLNGGEDEDSSGGLGREVRADGVGSEVRKSIDETNPMLTRERLQSVSMRDTLDGDVTLTVEMTPLGVTADREGASDDPAGGAADAGEGAHEGGEAEIAARVVTSLKAWKQRSTSPGTIETSTLRRESLAMAHLHAEAEAAARKASTHLRDDKPKQIRIVLDKLRGYVALFLSRDAAESGA